MQKIADIFGALLIFNAFVACTLENVVDYYEDLITNGIQNSMTYQSPTDASEFRPRNENPVYYGTYDFVVVGAGSSGAVVANRLSETFSWKVLLLEAGKPGSNFTDIPAMYNYLPNTEYNWGFVSTTQSTCCLAANGNCPYPRGKALGGSSTIHGLAYVRGNKLDYDNWGSAGNEGWYYKDVLPYFQKSENNNVFGNTFYHSVGGYLNIERPKPVSRVIRAYVKANVEVGTPIGDYNGANQLVTEISQFTGIQGRRMSTEKAFLNPVRDRRNLNILTESYVTRIVIDGLSKTATGVVFSHRNISYVVNASKEVILSAGVIGSAQLLMLSGVGSRNQLRQYGISVIANLQVGQSFNDHMYLPIMFNASMPELQSDLKNTIQQYIDGYGPLTSLADASSLHNLYWDNSTVPNIEVLLFPLKPIGTDNTQPVEINKYRQFAISSILLNSKSIGKVYLKSSDPYQYPEIDMNCLNDPQQDDVAQFLQGINFMLELVKRDAFKEYNPELLIGDSCTQFDVMSKAYWKCVIRREALPSGHGTGTCRMGSNPREGAVVDNRLRVYGVRKLRVADCSIIPVVLAGHTNAAAVMIGERVADFIKEDYHSF